MAFHGFGTATRMLSPTYWHVQTYFRPSTGGIQKHGALLPQEASLKGLEGGDFGFYIRKTLLRQMDVKRPRHPPPGHIGDPDSSRISSTRSLILRSRLIMYVQHSATAKASARAPYPTHAWPRHANARQPFPRGAQRQSQRQHQPNRRYSAAPAPVPAPDLMHHVV